LLYALFKGLRALKLTASQRTRTRSVAPIPLPESDIAVTGVRSLVWHFNALPELGTVRWTSPHENRLILTVKALLP